MTLSDMPFWSALHFPGGTTIYWFDRYLYSRQQWDYLTTKIQITPAELVGHFKPIGVTFL